MIRREEIEKFLNQSQNKYCQIKGLYGSAKSLIVASTLHNTDFPKINIVVEDNKESAEYFCSDLYTQIDEKRVFYFPFSNSQNNKSFSIKESSNKVMRGIVIEAINNFCSEEKKESIVIVAYPESIKEKILNKESLRDSVLSIKLNEETDFEKIKELLYEAEFERVDYIDAPGQFAIRGSIIDIFSFSNDKPYRIDFFGNTPESIRIFDVDTQRTISEVDKIEIFPNINDESKILAKGGSSIFDFIPDEFLIIWNSTFEKLQEEYPLNSKIIDLTGRVIKTNESNAIQIINHFSPQPSFNKNFLLLADDIRNKTKQEYKVYITSSSVAQIERIKNIFNESTEIANSGVPHFIPLNYSLHEGFVSVEDKICIYTDHQIFERFHRVKLRREVKRSERLTLEELNSYHIGDYIVHIDHGVGVFGGLAKTMVNGKQQEVVKLMYKDGDVIFLSVHSLHKIAKYKSKEGIPPKIYKLGSGAWNKIKQNTKSKIKDIAKDLIELYSKRKQSQGFAFSPDTYYQKELEASFIWEDTPDQIKATAEVKSDMEKNYPMDRLICGDVGFGKTEIAIRAAFKAAVDGKQVCVLVPTTILALQHYKTFTDRLKQFPVNIDFLSRLKSAKEQKEIAEKIKEGKIEIIIGTHRLLNKKIEFKDLGLLIIDEEQKFGVAAKERLRQLKVEVDTLTLTATPIPRTLQFSLLGARDLSIITTPPPNRLPVQTEIIDFREDYIKEIIENEVKRGGQIFFIHNRVEDILAVEQMINRICPNIKTVVGHGQMEPKELENKILEFIRGDYDVLICTTIVENGIDIPNANTIIINHAQKFGLSDLHQLRGRVGRSNIKAYCYLIVPPISSITEDAKRRLKAIEAFSELGSGFNIAMQDLDIRGAGNLLGGEQSGFIADMGFETYQRILNEAFVEIHSELGIEENIKNEDKEVEYVSDVVIDTDLELFIPENYVEQSYQRIKLYKELDTLKTEEDIEKFLAELKDKYGTPPQQVIQLVSIVRIRQLAIKLGFEKIVLKGNTLLMYFVSNRQSNYFRSEIFVSIIEWIQNRRDCQWREEGEKSWIRMPMVVSIDQAYKILKNIYSSKKEK